MGSSKPSETTKVPAGCRLDSNQLDALWWAMFDSQVFTEYFARLSQRYAGFTQTVRAISGFLCLGSASAAFAYGERPWLAGTLAALAGVVTMCDIVWRFSEKAAEASTLGLAWNRLAIRYSSLWSHTFEEDAERRLLDLEDRRADLTQRQNGLNHSRRWYHKEIDDSAEYVLYRISSRPDRLSEVQEHP